jgi:hypothetical protein
VNPPIDLDTVSGSNGRVVRPGATACVDCYEIGVTKSGYSTDRTYSTAEVANPLKPHATVIEGEVTALTLTIDQTSTLQVLTTGRRENNYPPFSGIQFQLRGSKLIGYDASDQPVYKYDQPISSGPGGVVTVSNLEWDTYEVFIPNPSTVNAY